MAENQNEQRPAGERSTAEQAPSAKERERELVRQGIDPDRVEPTDDARHQEQREETEGFDEDKPGEHRTRFFTRDQLVHEAAIETRQHYGVIKFDVDPDSMTYGERREELGYYDLLDCWMVVAHMLDESYHQAFLKWAMPFPWTARTNRHLIPNFYLVARDGVAKAVKQQYISPRIDHRIKFNLFAFVPPVTPPLGYYDFVGMSTAEAKRHGDFLGEGRGEAGRTGRIRDLKRKYAIVFDDYEEAVQNFQDAQRTGDSRAMQQWEKAAEQYDRQLNQIEAEIEQLKTELGI